LIRPDYAREWPRLLLCLLSWRNMRHRGVVVYGQAGRILDAGMRNRHRVREEWLTASCRRTRRIRSIVRQQVLCTLSSFTLPCSQACELHGRWTDSMQATHKKKLDLHRQQAWRGRAAPWRSTAASLTQHPTLRARRPALCTPRSTSVQGVCVPLHPHQWACSRCQPRLQGATRVIRWMHYSDSNCCGRREERGRGRAAAGRDSWCAAGDEMRAWHPQVGFHSATDTTTTPGPRTSLMAVRGLNERGRLAETRPC
jgi:hypothetical protein